MTESSTISADPPRARAGHMVRVRIMRVHGSAPRGVGASMLVWQDGQSGSIGGGVLEWNATIRAREMLASGGERMRQDVALGPELGQCCGGRVELLFEHLRAVPEDAAGLPVFLYGAGHVGREIVRVLQGLPFDITWVDVAAERFSGAGGGKRLIYRNPAAAVRLAPDNALHFVMTHAHGHDLEICHSVLSRRFGHLGLIGSASKKARFLKRLRELGHDDATLERLQCPIGDRRLGKTPEAIAIGVAHWLMHRKIKAEEPEGEGRV